MAPTLSSIYIVNEELSAQKMEISINEELMYVSVILQKIQDNVWKILEGNRVVQLSYATISQLREEGYNSPWEYAVNLNTHICFILKELWENALDACIEKFNWESELWVYKQKIELRVQYNQNAGTILIRMRDNGIWIKSNLNNDKKRSPLGLHGWKNVFDLYLRDFDFVIQHKRILTNNWTLVQVKIKL